MIILVIEILIPKIILLSGAKRSGKDTFANYLEEHYGYKHIKITTKLKNCIKMLFDLEDEDLEDNKELVNPEWKVTPRRIMQFMGTEMFQNKIQELIPNIGKTFWIKSLLNNELITKLMTNKEYKIVISDLRFIHELEEIKKLEIYNQKKQEMDNPTAKLEKIEFTGSLTGYNDSGFSCYLTLKNNNKYFAVGDFVATVTFYGASGSVIGKPYKDKIYHPLNWRKIVDFGCGTLGDMGVHIFDTPYNALELDVPITIKNNCRKPNEFGFPEKNLVTYEFPGTKYTTEKLKWVWEDGSGVPKKHKDLKLPNKDKLPMQGAMFIGEKGRLLLPHFMELPKLIVDNKYVELDLTEFEKSGQITNKPVRDYSGESYLHYHQFVDACLGKDTCSAPFSYSARLTETILLGVIAGRFPGKTLHWDNNLAKFKEEEANKFLDSPYREF